MTEKLKQLKEEYEKKQKQIDNLEKYNKTNPLSNYQTLLNELTKQRDAILKLINELMEQLNKEDSNKKTPSHSDIIHQVERLLGIKIKNTGNKDSLLQDKKSVYRKLNNLYKLEKIDYRTFIQMRNEIIKEYDEMIISANNEQAEINYNIDNSQIDRFNQIVRENRQRFEENNRRNLEESEEQIENHRRIM